MEFDAPAPAKPPPPSGGLLAIAYLVASFSWMFVVGLAASVALLVHASWNGAGPEVLERPPTMPTGGLAAATLAQFGGMLAIAAALATRTRKPLREVFAWRPAVPAQALGIGAASGLIIGIIPGKIAEYIASWMPYGDHGTLDRIGDALHTGSLGERAWFIATLCVFAPLVEELVFRGFLFHTLTAVVGRWGALFATSALFAAYHLDPVQGTAVLFTGLFLGWLRFATGSVWPAVLAHVGNNLIATLYTLGLGGPPTGEAMPAWVAALAAAALTGLAAGLAPRGTTSPSR